MWTAQVGSENSRNSCTQWNAEIHSPDVFVNCRNSSTCLSFRGKSAAPKSIGVVHGADSAPPWLAGMPGSEGSGEGAMPLRQWWIQREPLLPRSHSASRSSPISQQHVHQPMAHVNHTNLETHLVKSGQSYSVGTHKIALQMDKVNCEQFHYPNTTDTTTLCGGFHIPRNSKN